MQSFLFVSTGVLFYVPTVLYLLMHRYNQELHHQDTAKVRDVVVFETRVLSSKLPWCTLLRPYVYFISSSFLNMLNVSEETGALVFDEY